MRHTQQKRSRGLSKLDGTSFFHRENLVEHQSVEPMAVGILHLELRLLSPRSLKEKRSIIKPVKNYLQAEYHMSVAEVEHQDTHQLAGLEVALVSNDRAYLQTALSGLSKSLERRFPVMLARERVEII